MSYHYSPTSSASGSDRDFNSEQDPNQRRPELEGNGPKPKRPRLDADNQFDFGFQPQDICFFPPPEYMSRRDHNPPYDENYQPFIPTPYMGLWEDDGALEYMASPDGFRRDLYHLCPPNPTLPSVNSETSNISPMTRGPELKRNSSNEDPRSFPGPPRRGQGEGPNHQFAHAYFANVPFWGTPMDMSSHQDRPSQMPTVNRFTHFQPGPNGRVPDYSRDIRVQPNDIRIQQIPSSRPHLPPTKGGISLVLKRATAAVIEELPEHKRECPACQLDFEPDNYLANISCCGTAMHATCLSAWVNSQTYAKVKVCMKCRKAIDARRPLNNVVPPVTDKSWDEGVDLNAPESLAADATIELDISGRPDRSVYRRARRPPPFRRRLPPSVVDFPPEMRNTIQKIQEDHQRDADALKNRYRTVYNEWNQAYEAEAHAAKAVSEARDALAAGNLRQTELDILIDRCREARMHQEKRYEVYRQVSREQERMKRDQQSRLTALMDDVHNNGHRAPVGDERTH